MDCLQIVPRVLGEIQVNLQEGRLFAQKVLDLISQGKLEVVVLTNGERESGESIPNRFGAGERDSVRVAQERGALLLTNESRVGHFCREKGIEYASLPSILRSCRLNGILDISELHHTIAELGTKDRMKFSEGTLEAIFGD